MQFDSGLKIVDVNNPEEVAIDQLLDLIVLFVHDLEGPFAAVQAILRLMDKGKLDLGKPSHIELVRSSKIAVERARSIIGDLLLVSRSNQLGLPVRNDLVLIAPLLENSVDLISPSAREYNIAVKLQGTDSDLMVEADADLVLRVLDNLLFNALRHAPPNSTVDIFLTEESDQLKITVADQGPGFSDFDPNELFDKFRQLKLRQEGKHRGVGLGLFFCHLVITAMGGKIWAQNRPGGGGEFNFTLKIKR